MWITASWINYSSWKRTFFFGWTGMLWSLTVPRDLLSPLRQLQFNTSSRSCLRFIFYSKEEKHEGNREREEMGTWDSEQKQSMPQGVGETWKTGCQRNYFTELSGKHCCRALPRWSWIWKQPELLTGINKIVEDVCARYSVMCDKEWARGEIPKWTSPSTTKLSREGKRWHINR